MVVDLFESILQDIGKAMNIPDIHADANNSCLIAFDTGIEVQIEPFERDDFLLIVCNLGEVPPGRYREDVFREALKSNGLPHPRYGTFAYSKQSDHLLLFGLISFREINGEKVASFIYPFMEKAAAWKQALERGDVPLANTMTTSQTSGPGGLFGLTR